MKQKPRTRKTYHAPKPVEEQARHAHCSFCGGKGKDSEVELVESKAGIRYRCRSRTHLAKRLFSLSLSLSLLG